MATGVQVFKSTDASAPVLTGQTGSLVALLDAVLVNGYGSKSAAGTGGAGAWSIAYTGTSQRAYQPSAGNRFYMSVIDNGPGAGTYKEARVVSYETMSALNTGSNPMPTAAQSANGLFLRKSTTVDSTPRAWKIVADDRTVMMFLYTGDSSEYFCAMWGDFYSYLSADSYRSALIANSAENAASSKLEFLQISASFATALAGHYIQRNHNGTTGAINVQKTTMAGGAHGSVQAMGQFTHVVQPNAPDGGLFLTPLFLHDVTTVTASNIRGYLRGLWNCMNNTATFNDGDTFSGMGAFAGKTFEIIKTGWSNGVFIVETSDTWDTSS